MQYIMFVVAKLFLCRHSLLFLSPFVSCVAVTLVRFVKYIGAMIVHVISFAFYYYVLYSLWITKKKLSQKHRQQMKTGV